MVSRETCRWNQISTTTRTAATAKNGAGRAKSRHNGRLNQAMAPSNMIGIGATDSLLSIARTKANKLSGYHRLHQVFLFPAFASTESTIPVLRNQRTERRKKKMASRFLRWAIQVTDSTFRG